MPVSSNEALSKLLFNQATEALVITDLTGNALEVNISFLSMFHRTVDEVLNKKLFETILFSYSIVFVKVI